MEPRSLRLLAALAALVFVAMACSAPPVAYRRSALVPLSTGPARTGRPLDQGEVRFAAQASLVANHGPNEYWLPVEEDPGVRIPMALVGGSIYGGITDYLELGFGASVGPNDWAEANFPNDVINFAAAPSLRVGPGVRFNGRVSDLLTISVVAETSVVRIPQALFVCVNAAWIDWEPDPFDPRPGGPPPGMPDGGWCTTSEEFELERIENYRRFMGALMLEPVVTVTDQWSVVLHGGVTQGFANIGFEPLVERKDEDTLTSYPTWVVGLGADFRTGPMFVGLNLDYLVPREPTIGPMPVVSLTIGPRVPGRDERRGAPVPTEPGESDGSDEPPSPEADEGVQPR